VTTAKPKKLTASERATRLEYEAAAPQQFGTLHERMKYLLACARRCHLHEFDNDTWQAIFDLETEVSCHQPARPPFGHRAWPPLR
jgi:hypothetical protein